MWKVHNQLQEKYRPCSGADLEFHPPWLTGRLKTTSEMDYAGCKERTRRQGKGQDKERGQITKPPTMVATDAMNSPLNKEKLELAQGRGQGGEDGVRALYFAQSYFQLKKKNHTGRLSSPVN